MRTENRRKDFTRLGYAFVQMSNRSASTTRIWNRAEQRIEAERVFGDVWLRLAYGTGIGRLLADNVLSRRSFSSLLARSQMSPKSAGRIPSFVERFGIPMEEFEEHAWESFNDFFVRRFRPDAREFVSEPEWMPAFAEARYLAFEKVDPLQSFPVKGTFLTPQAILGDRDLAANFDGGPMLLARLAPVDYHRFHFPDDGEPVAERRISGRFHSVNPFALRHRPSVLATNERHISILRTENFGTLAMVEVGAMNVGLIVQTHPRGEPFVRGDEKGYFCFGASTVMLFGQPRTWLPVGDLLDQTEARRETLVRLGEEVARAV
jgi:phosphatidylserine decarboxylase